MNTVRASHEEGKILLEFIIGKPAPEMQQHLF